VYKEDFLFVAECKNSLLPTDIYELRNIYDSLNKANKQLNLVLDALKDSNYEEGRNVPQKDVDMLT